MDVFQLVLFFFFLLPDGSRQWTPPPPTSFQDSTVLDHDASLILSSLCPYYSSKFMRVDPFVSAFVTKSNFLREVVCFCRAATKSERKEN